MQTTWLSKHGTRCTQRIRIALSNSISQLNESQEKREDVESVFFFKMLLVWGLFQKKHHGPNGSQTTGFAGFGLTAHQLGTATHLCRSTWSTFVFVVSLRLGSKVFGPKKLGQGLNLDSFCYAAWLAALCFFFTEEWFGMIFVFFSMKLKNWNQKKTPPCRKCTPCFTLLFLPNALENLKWKLLNSIPTFLTNHPPRNYDVSHLGKS